MNFSSARYWKRGAALAAVAVASVGAMPFAHATEMVDNSVNSPNEPIIVTGTHLNLAQGEQAAALMTLTAEQIALTGKSNLTEYLIRNPALTASLGPAQATAGVAAMGQSAVNVLNLRNLGPQRTLILVNGKRHVAGVANTSAVDINSIPMELVERVDILTGGASAIYGADGVSGVVNFITKRDFAGLTAKAQMGLSSRGDAASQIFSVTAGNNFADGRGNVTLAYEFNGQNRLHSNKRAVTGDPDVYARLVRDASYMGGERYIYRKNLTWDFSSPAGVVMLPDGYYLGDGTPYTPGEALGTNGFAIGGMNTPAAAYYGDLVPQVDRHTVSVSGQFEFSSAARFYFDGKYSDVKSLSYWQPSYLGEVALAPTNAFLIDRFGPDRTMFGALIMGRDNFDFGLRGEENDRETTRIVVGVDGNLSDHLRYDISLNYGRTNVQTRQYGELLTDRLYAAIDAMQDPISGEVRCAVDVDPNWPSFPFTPYQPISTFTPGVNSGCQPLNLLGEGAADPAAIAFVTADAVNQARISQLQISGVISGDSGAFWELPGGPLNFAVGGEYRREKSRFTPNSYLQNGELFRWLPMFESKGRYSVSDIFAEVNVPLLRDMPLAHKLNLGAALRHSDYSSVGKTTSWKFDALYAPVQDLSLRATYSQAVRAPNIHELYRPMSPVASTILDPCHVGLRNLGSATRAENCTALLGGLGLSEADIASFAPSLGGSYLGIAAGNENVKAERAKSWTLGATWTPQFAPALRLNMDWYDIKVRNVIEAPTAQQLADYCVDQAQLDASLCGMVYRDPTTGQIGGQRTSVAVPFGFATAAINMAVLETSGADFSIGYVVEPSAKSGSFQFNLQGGYLHQMTLRPLAGAAPVDLLREVGNPRWRGNASVNWTRGDVSLHYAVNYWSKTQRFTNEQLRLFPQIAEPQYLWFREKIEHDARASVVVDQMFNLYGGVNNLFDRKTDFGEMAYPMSAVGRYFYAGVRINI